MDSTDTRNTHTVFISDEAWKALIQLAIDDGHINAAGNNANGIADFITKYMNNKQLFDSRPADIKEQDADLVAAGLLPEWQCYSPRKKRNVALPNLTLIQACIHAFRLHITTTKTPPLRGAPKLLDGVRCLSLLLEALGTGWISDQLP